MNRQFLIPSIVFLLLLTGCNSTPLTSLEQASANQAYIANIQVIKDPGKPASNDVTGTVFHDKNGNGVLDSDEDGIANVAVSNGRDVVRTDQQGNYRLNVREDMSLFVIQPSGWRVPTDNNFVPQFSYEHKPLGSPKPLRYGGLAPTGPIPAAVNFPLKISNLDGFSCAVLGDIQAYTNQDIGYFRDSTLDDILDGNSKLDCVLAVGDVMGDDLDLIPRMASVIGTLKVPQWWTHGNHDFDFDADSDADSADSWRNLWGPAYYAFEIGQVLFIVLDNVVYPCGPDDTGLSGREFCVNQDKKRYNGRLADAQLEFTRQLIQSTDSDKTIVFTHHIPFVSFVYQSYPEHKTDNVKQIYAMAEGRKAVSISGHTHTTENLAPGDHFKDWSDVLGAEGIPFRHIVAGAGSGSWYQGDFDIHGTPMALQKLGGPKGWLELVFDAQGDYIESYYGANQGRDRVAWLSVSTPGFRDWFTQITAWLNTAPEQRDPVPPLSINDLADVKALVSEDLIQGSYLTANVWAGSSDTRVTVTIDGGASYPMVRTQQARGEAARTGADFADPFAAQRQLSVSRIALQSRSGKEANQGYHSFRDLKLGPAVPQPQPMPSVTDRNMHLWTFKLPQGLSVGSHLAEVTILDRHGREFKDTLVFEVLAQRPQMRFRLNKWQAFENGPPVNR